MKKKLAYLFWAVVCIAAAFEGLFGDMDGTSIGMRIFLAIVFVLIAIYLFGKFKATPADTPESSQEAPSDAPTAKTAPITHTNTNGGVEDDYVAIDIETTGLGRDARIIELGAVRIPAVLIRLLSWMAVFLGFPMVPRLFVNSGNSL